MKKTLVVLLALMMVFAFATTAMAADKQYVPYADIADQDVDIQTAIERLTILGALKGYDAEGTKYAPAQLITREEFATIGVRIAGLEDQVALYASMKSAFTDVEEGRWSEGYINAANENGIMIGRGNGIFDPKANVTMQEVTTVLLRAVGYDDRLPGAWPSDYNTKAVNVGITEYVDYIGPKAATRGEVASLVNETLDLWTVQYVEDTTGLGQIIGGVIQWIDGVNIPVVDKDNYMYVIDATNEEGNYGTTLLNQTFDADGVYNAIFNDGATLLSEAKAWGFEDFADWELEAYYGDGSEDTPDTDENTREFAALYGISKGQDVTDLGWQIADLTINSKGEIIYVDLTSDVVRTAEVTAAQDKAIKKADLKVNAGTTLAEDGYGEIWYDADGKIYAAKDFDITQFTEKAFGIVDDVDEDEVYFKGTPTFTNVDLDDDVVFYIVGEGFIDAADLEEGDVLYKDSVYSVEDFYFGFRPVEASLDDKGRDSIEIDDVEYGVIANRSFYSINQGDSFVAYNWDVVDTYDWSDNVVFVPAYAFTNFAYFADSLSLANAGLLDSYVIGRSDERLDNTNSTRVISGMNILFPGDNEPTLVEFAKDITVGDARDDSYPTEGAYVEYTINSDGEFVEFTAAHDWMENHNTAAVGEWTGTANNRLDLFAKGSNAIDDVYSFADGAVIYVVATDDDVVADDLYDIGSGKVYTVDTFIEEYGDDGFTAAEICIYDADNTRINTLYIRDIDATGDAAYGIGLYQGFFRESNSKNNYYIKLNEGTDAETQVLIDKDATDIAGIKAALDKATVAIVAYKTEGGRIVDMADIAIIDDTDTCDDIGAFNAAVDAFDFENGIEYTAACADFAEYTKASGSDPAQVNVDGVDGTMTLYLGSFVAGYDLDTNKDVVANDFRDMADGQHFIVIHEATDNDMFYVLVCDTCARD